MDIPLQNPLTWIFDNWTQRKRMEVKHVSAIDGTFTCPECPKLFKSIQGLKYHTKNSHGIKVTTCLKLTDEQKRERNRKYVAKHREKTLPRKSKRIKKKIVIRDCYDSEDARRRGTFGCDDPLIEYRASTIPNAGNGIFANEDLHPGDVVTMFAGPRVSSSPLIKSHTIQFGKGIFIDGLRMPVNGEGLGSFINRESRDIPRKRKNCEFVREQELMTIEITRKVKARQELYTTYSHGYRIRSVEH